VDFHIEGGLKELGKANLCGYQECKVRIGATKAEFQLSGVKRAEPPR
jgi:hypothetical protein